MNNQESQQFEKISILDIIRNGFLGVKWVDYIPLILFNFIITLDILNTINDETMRNVLIIGASIYFLVYYILRMSKDDTINNENNEKFIYLSLIIICLLFSIVGSANGSIQGIALINFLYILLLFSLTSLVYKKSE